MSGRALRSWRLMLAALLLLVFVTPPAAGFREEQKRGTRFQRDLTAEIEAMLRDRDRRVRALQRADRPSAEPWQIPVRGVAPAELVDTFGALRSGGRRHKGIDIFAPRGTAVVAAVAAVVASMRHTPVGGRCVYLVSADGYTFYYAHLDRWAEGLREGDNVRAGETIGYVGNSGNARGSSCHLHFEVEEKGRSLNPFVLLRRNAGDEVLPVGSGTGSHLSAR